MSGRRVREPAVIYTGEQNHGGDKAMILGMSISSFTTLHVVISLIGIASGIIVLFGMLGGRHLGGLTEIFLATTVLTSVTGFMFPFGQLLPSHIFGIISLIVLALALLALYAFHLTAAWRPVYVVSALIALYLNVFVGVVQAFQKLPALQGLAPTQSEPPFLIAQLAVLIVFIVLGYLAVKAYRPATMTAA
jgi:hypothetical protein